MPPHLELIGDISADLQVLQRKGKKVRMYPNLDHRPGGDLGVDDVSNN